jgi:hypothetical protein
MAESTIAALAFVIVSLPLVFIALRFRAGMNLEAINGFHPDRIKDRVGFGRFVGNHLLAMAVLLLAMAPVLMFADERTAAWATLAMVALMQVPVVRLVLGASKFHRK